MAGGWEFPGGKLEVGESAMQGLARELREELGITLHPGPHRPLRSVRHVYSDRIVEIRAWLISDYRGKVSGLDGQALRWCSRGDLPIADLLPADAPFVRALGLPDHLDHLDTDCYSMIERLQGRQYGSFCEDISTAIDVESSGADFVVLDRLLESQSLRALCNAVRLPVYAKGIPMGLAWSLGATGTHTLQRRRSGSGC